MDAMDLLRPWMQRDVTIRESHREHFSLHETNLVMKFREEENLK